MGFVHSETELTTAATDAVLGLLCVAVAVQVWATPTTAEFARALWVSAFALLGVGSLLGAAAHGIELDARIRGWLWKPLYLSLGLAVALVAVAAAGDWWGLAVARPMLRWALGAGVLFFAATQWLGGAFVLFIAYEAAAIGLALVIYGLLWMNGSAGAGAMAVGVALSLVAAAVQVSSLSMRVFVRFDHNGLFHLIQMLGVLCLSAGVRQSLQA